MAMITKVWPGWYRIDDPVYTQQYAERERWCKDNIGFTDADTWVFQKPHSGGGPGKFSFKDEKWALMYVLRWL